ncbi:peptide-methionine (S)-S-oxide reductase MsrA [Marinobacterium sedimentorum]|uniref:peptide-methionine (S)-S-oxide reductase MsrA n=1 Tax=Marinobacterium sedimentorum TaxID=2927804 RepID=UPI0020C73306|nr:peptide-methionine (S)-S-oxide reductase MsrA [Marinobacterium sedimentorum]MCP8689189.1 peptide-methionine (S)-S-oxide reductase MsrA [Marinobacterium sedimentorum]
MKIHAIATLALLGALQPSAVLADKAIFAGGCFWCMEQAFQPQTGVTDVVSGFTGGTLENPVYDGNHDGHYEAIEITYDPKLISYQQLLDLYWVNVDPFDSRGQFCDKGPSYLSAIFVLDDSQRALAEASRQQVVNEFADSTVVTPVLDATRFYPVVEGHQDYYIKNPIRYRYYKAACRRVSRLQDIWGERASH